MDFGAYLSERKLEIDAALDRLLPPESGPAKTVAANADAFRKMVEGMTAR